MKLSSILLLAVVAIVAADSSYEQYDENYPQQEHSNYYSNRRSQPAKRQGLLGKLKRALGIGATRRQFTGPTGTGTGFTGATTGGQFIAAPAANTGGGFPLLPAVLLGGLGLLGLAALAGAAIFVTQLNNSGRGLDTDEWEVDHSVWMDQLQKDFEDSWSQS